MNTQILKGELRKDTGKRATQKLRADGFIPCNLYGGEQNVNFYAPVNDFKDLIYTPDFFKTNIQVDGKEYEAVIREVQFHPVTDEITHIDFLELVPGRAVTVDIPVETEGLARGVKNGGKLILKTRKIRIKTTPENMVDLIKVDVTNLRLGKSVKVSEIEAEGFEILTSPSIPVASVVTPRAMRSEGLSDEDEDEEGTEEGEGSSEEANKEEASAEA